MHLDECLVSKDTVKQGDSMKFKKYLDEEATLGGDIAAPDIMIGADPEKGICPYTGDPK
jgi:hypothetical protein